MQEYRGIKVDDSVKLFMKNGEYNKRVTNSLSKMIERAEKNDEKIIGVYKSNEEKIDILYSCGHIIPSYPYRYKEGRGCVLCKHKNTIIAKEYRGIKVGDNVKIFKKNGEYNKKVTDSLDRLIEISFEEGYEIIGEFKGMKEKIEINFNCGHKPRSILCRKFIEGQRCKECFYDKDRKQSEEDFLSLVKKRGFTTLSNYKDNHTHVKMKCPKGHVLNFITPANFKKGSLCVYCYGRSNEQGRESFEKLIKEENYLLLSDYKNDKTKIVLQCPKGHISDTLTPNNFKGGTRCPACSDSKGERIIKDWLKEKRISFQPQLRLENNKLYDIYIVDENLIVEVHGKQHYEEIDFFRNRTLQDEQKNDKAKKDYARSLGYNYMVIDYREGKPQLALERFKKQYTEFKEKN